LSVQRATIWKRLFLYQIAEAHPSPRRPGPPYDSPALVEIHGNRLAFVTSAGKLAALFLFDLVESWNEITPESNPPYL
jgi:hypothetical protein